MASIPNWKWEGYAEYISRNGIDQKDLSKNIQRLQQTPDTSWAVKFSNQTIAPKNYYEFWNLVQYCMDIKKMNYREILLDTASEANLKKEMMQWFSSHSPK